MEKSVSLYGGSRSLDCEASDSRVPWRSSRLSCMANVWPANVSPQGSMMEKESLSPVRLRRVRKVGGIERCTTYSGTNAPVGLRCCRCSRKAASTLSDTGGDEDMLECEWASGTRSAVPYLIRY